MKKSIVQKTQRVIFCLAVLLTAFTFVVLTATKAQAQQVIGVSIVYPHPVTVDTYSATQIDYTTYYYYDPYVEGYLFKRPQPLLPWQQINSGYAYGGKGGSSPLLAGGTMQSPLTVPSEYQLESDHYLIACYSYYNETLGLSSYWNPSGFGFMSSGNPNGFQFLPNYGPTYVEEDFIKLGTTVVYYPVIPNLTITPFSSVMEGGSREVEVKMENLPFNDYAQVSLPSTASNGHATFDSGSYSLVVGNGTTKVILKGIVKSDSVDDQKIRIAYGGVQTDELFSVVKLGLKNVSFSGTPNSQGANNYRPVIKDTSTTHESYDAPHWVVSSNGSPEQKNPVSYVRNGKMKVSAEWSPSPDTNIDFPAPKVKGDGNGNLDFSDTSTTIGSGASGNSVKINEVEAANPFADTIDYLDPLKIDWQISSQPPSYSDTWNNAGSSQNPVYVMLNYMSRTYIAKDAVLYLSCKNAKGLTDPNAIIAAIWNGFKNRDVVTRENRQLHYYQDYLTNITFPYATRSGPGLIEAGDGQCGSWANLLGITIRMQGVSTPISYVTAKVKQGGLWIASTNNPTGFLVKSGFRSKFK